MLEQGADPNATDDKGRGPLYAAIDMRNLEWSTRPAPPEKDTLSDLDLIKALLDHGANPNARLTKKIPLRGQPSFDGRWANAIGATPFWRAAQSDDVTVMRLLKDRGADPLIATKDHTTPLMVAAGVGWSDGQSHGSQADAPEALKLCLEWGGDVNAVNDGGLHGAAWRVVPRGQRSGTVSGGSRREDGREEQRGAPAGEYGGGHAHWSGRLGGA